MSAGFSINTPEGIRFFTVRSVASALSLEIVTGMKISSRGSALQAAKIQGIVPATCRSKKAALQATVELLQELQPGFEIPATVRRALDK